TSTIMTQRRLSMKSSRGGDGARPDTGATGVTSDPEADKLCSALAPMGSAYNKAQAQDRTNLPPDGGVRQPSRAGISVPRQGVCYGLDSTGELEESLEP